MQSARTQLELVAHLSRWLAGQRLEVAALSPATVDGYLAARRDAGYRTLLSAKALEPLLVYLRGVGVVPVVADPALTPVDVLLECFRHYLLGERGLVVRAVRGYVDLVRPFVTGRSMLAWRGAM